MGQKNRATVIVRAISEFLEQRRLLNGAPELNPNTDRSSFAPIQVQPTLTLPLKMTPLTAPSSFSLRPTYVTGVRDQGNLGSCWTFATYGSLESGILKGGGGALDFSENNLAKYHGFDWGPNDGGNSWISEAYLSRGSGPISEADDPYIDFEDNIDPAPVLPRTGWVTEMLRFDTSAELKDALMTRGALYVSMHWADASYRASDYTYYYTGTGGNHAVTLVGWDDNKATAAPTPGAWLIKNSWGSGWGDGGYFWISYADSVAVKDGEWFGSQVAPEQFDKAYYHDDFGDVSSGIWSHAMNRFVPGYAEQLKSVGFFTQADGASYTVTIYDSLVGGVPTGALTTFSGAQAFAGWHTVALPSSVSLQAGNDFYVRVSLSNGGTYPHAVDMAYPGYASDSTAAPNESWYSTTGTTWTDLNTWDSTANFSIKAYTSPIPADGADLAATSISLASDNLRGGDATVSLSVRNFGLASAAESNIRFYLSSDAVIDASNDILLTLNPADPHYLIADASSLRMQSLAAGGSVSYTVTLVAPESDPFDAGGDYFLGMIVDADNEVVESGAGAENNNRNVGLNIDRAAAIYRITVYSADMDGNPGWALQGQWAWGQPAGWGGSSGSPDPTSGYTGTKVMGYDLLGDYPNSMPVTSWAKTPAIDCSAVTGTQLSFYRWLGVEDSTFDHAYLEVSNNNVTWTSLWANTGQVDDGGWRHFQYDIASVADGSSTVYVRWGMGITDSSLTFCGWNIDDVLVTARGQESAPTDLLISDDTIPETQAPGLPFATFTAEDPDADETFTYSLVDGVGATDNALFQIDGDRIKALGFLNYETKSIYSIRVRASDSTGQSLSKVFAITLIDCNDAPSGLTLSSSTIVENLPAGSPVGTLLGVDPDQGDTLQYSLVSGIGATDNALFEIVAGQLVTKTGFDFEARRNYSVRVRATDAGSATFEKAMPIAVLNANDAPHDITLTPSVIAENRAAGFLVGNLRSIDQDSMDPTSFLLVPGDGSADNASFTIDGLGLKTAAAFNYEARNSYTIRVRATDTAGATFEKALTVSITNVNEAPTAVTLSKSTIAENAGISAPVGTLATVDPDGGSFTYSLVIGDGSADNGLFEIVSGILRAKQSINFELRSTFSVRVRSVDADGLAIEQPLLIQVTDVNEAPTAVTDTLSLNGLGRLDISVLANDRDPENSALKLVSATQALHGSVVVNTNGTLTYRPLLGYRGADTFTYVVRDSGGMASTGRVNVNVVIPTVASVIAGGTAGDDIITVSLVDGVLRSIVNNTVRQFMFAGITMLSVQALGGNDRVTVAASVTKGMAISGSTGNDTIFGGSGNDTISGSDGLDEIHGNAGDDRLDGGIDNDRLYGDAGNDWITAMAGAHSIYGGLGNDTVFGGTLNDLIDGGADADQIIGGAGNDTLLGGTGTDSILGDVGNDSLTAGDGNDTLRGGTGLDSIYGDAGMDLLFGDSEGDLLRGGLNPDTIDGGLGDDLVYGDEDNDRLVGGDGNDRAFGGTGNDIIYGGLGNDSMGGDAGNDSLYAGAGLDTLRGDAGTDNLFGEDGNDVFFAIDLIADRIDGGLGTDLAHRDPNDLLISVETAVLV